MYLVKEIFLTLQGEGFHSGRVALFCRFSGCNLWSGRQKDRHKAICKFCDTDFVGISSEGGKFKNATQLADKLSSSWKQDRNRFVVFTGGEPLLQLDKDLIQAVAAMGFEIAIETNGTIAAPGGIDWICVSPKFGSKLVQVKGQEIKVVYPQKGFEEGDLDYFSTLDFEHFYLQPLDGKTTQQNRSNIAACVEICKRKPIWKLSLQTHKLIGLR